MPPEDERAFPRLLVPGPVEGCVCYCYYISKHDVFVRVSPRCCFEELIENMPKELKTEESQLKFTVLAL